MTQVSRHSCFRQCFLCCRGKMVHVSGLNPFFLSFTIYAISLPFSHSNSAPWFHSFLIQLKCYKKLTQTLIRSHSDHIAEQPAHLQLLAMAWYLSHYQSWSASRLVLFTPSCTFLLLKTLLAKSHSAFAPHLPQVVPHSFYHNPGAHHLV